MVARLLPLILPFLGCLALSLLSDAFVVVAPQKPSLQRHPSSLSMAKKGFGAAPSSPTPKATPSKSKEGPSANASAEDEVEVVPLVAGADAFKQMQEEKKKREEAQERRIEELRAGRDATKLDPKAGVIPEVVANRMLSRMVPFFGLPVISGVGLFIFYFVLAKKYEMSFQPSVVAFSTQAPFAISLIGITYAIISSSWDPEREGDFLGFDEAKKNVGSIFDGLKSSRERQQLDDVIQERNRLERRRSKRERED